MFYDIGEAFKHLAVLTDHIEASAKMLQRSFNMFGVPIQIQARPMQTKTLNYTNKREKALSYNGKRKREIDGSEACSSEIKKSHKEIEDKSRPNKTVSPEKIIINDNGISINQNIDRIISEKNRGELIPIQTETSYQINERQNVLSYNNKRKRELDSSEACSSGIKKSYKETEDESRPNKTVCPENITVNDNGNSIPPDTGRLTNEKNKGKLIPTQTGKLDKSNERENMLSYNGKRMRETDIAEASGSGIKKNFKKTEDISSSDENECPETIIISDKGISISRNIDRITSEKNRGSVILSRIQTDKLSDGLLFHPMTKPSARTEVMDLSQKYVDDFFKSTGIDLTYRKKTVNCECNCVCLGP